MGGLLAEPTILCGELPAAPPGRWDDLAPQAQLVSPTLNARRAACLAEIAWARHDRGERDDPVALEPIYLHGPSRGRTEGSTQDDAGRIAAGDDQPLPQP